MADITCNKTGENMVYLIIPEKKGENYGNEKF